MHYSSARCVYLGTALIAFLLHPARSQPITIYGPDIEQFSCGTWSAEQNMAKRSARESWLMGVVTGYNLYRSSEAVSAPDTKAMLVWVDRYCAAHPLETLPTAALALINELRKRIGLPAEGH
jgi:hypothetical protein